MSKATRSVSDAERGIHISIRVPRTLLEQAQAYGKLCGVNRTKVIVRALALMMENPPPPLARGEMPKA